VNAIVPLVAERTEAMLRQWHGYAQRGEAFDLAPEMTRLTLGIVLKAFVKADLDDARMDAVCRAISVAMRLLGEMACSQLNRPLVIAPDHQRRFNAARAQIDDVVDEIIAARRRTAQAGDDLLGILLNAPDGTTGKPLSERQIRDEIATLMISGHETTSLILSWAFVLLARHPHVEARLHAEVDAALDSPRAGMGDLNRMPLCKHVLEEGMRLYPPVWFTMRKAADAATLGGLSIPRGAAVLVSAFALHRHPDFWPNAEDFDPFRFAPGSPHPADRNAYFPFGGGRHVCVGRALAMVEGQLILAMVARAFRVTLEPGAPIEPEAAITLRQAGGVPVRLEARPGARWSDAP